MCQDDVFVFDIVNISKPGTIAINTFLQLLHQSSAVDRRGLRVRRTDLATAVGEMGNRGGRSIDSLDVMPLADVANSKERRAGTPQPSWAE